MSSVTTNDKNTNLIGNNSEKKMIRESMKVHSSDIAFANCKSLGLGGRCLHEVPQLGVEVVREILGSDLLVISHYLVNIRINLRMKDEPHQLPCRRSICASSSSSEIADEVNALSSESRRRASAMPSSSS